MSEQESAYTPELVASQPKVDPESRWWKMGAEEFEETPQETTAARRATARYLGVVPPPWPYEIELYRKAGLEPPTE